MVGSRSNATVDEVLYGQGKGEALAVVVAHGFGDEVVEVEFGVGDGADLIVFVDEVANSGIRRCGISYGDL